MRWGYDGNPLTVRVIPDPSRPESGILQRPGEHRAALVGAWKAAALRPPIRSDKPAPILICLLVWAVLSALAWASVGLVIHLV